MADREKTTREIDAVARAIHAHNRDWTELSYDQVFNDAERMADAAIKTLDNLRGGRHSEPVIAAPTSRN